MASGGGVVLGGDCGRQAGAQIQKRSSMKRIMLSDPESLVAKIELNQQFMASVGT